MRSRDAGRPVGRTLKDLASDIQQELLAAPVVEPVDAFEVVAASDVLPTARQELLGGDVQLVLEVPAHEGGDAPVASGLMQRLQAEEHDHVRPEVVVLLVLRRAEVTVRLLARESRVEPRPRVGDDLGVLQNIAQIAVALQPVR